MPLKNIEEKLTPVVIVDSKSEEKVVVEKKEPEKQKVAATNTQTESDQSVLESLQIESNFDWKQTLKNYELQEEAAIKGLLQLN